MINITVGDVATRNSLSVPWLSWWINKTRPSAPGAAAVELHGALHRAYRRFADAHPDWVARGLTMDFLHRSLTPHLLEQYSAGCASKPRTTGRMVALAWERQFGPLVAEPSRRLAAQAALIPVADDLLSMVAAEVTGR